MVTLDEQLVREAQRRARFIVATNVLDHGDLAGEEATGLYKAQSGVERGMAFLKDPLVLASSMVVKKPERIMTLSLIMVVCLVVYRLAEWRLRQAVAHTERTVPKHLHQPADHPTMRCMLECFEDIHLSGHQSGSRQHGGPGARTPAAPRTGRRTRGPRGAETVHMRQTNARNVGTTSCPIWSEQLNTSSA